MVGAGQVQSAVGWLVRLWALISAHALQSRAVSLPLVPGGHAYSWTCRTSCFYT